MTLVAGTSLGPYEVRAPLGAGGMGEVYRARDPLNPTAVISKALYLYHCRRFDESISTLDGATELVPGFAIVEAVRSWAYLGKGWSGRALLKSNEAVEMLANRYDPLILSSSAIVAGAAGVDGGEQLVVLTSQTGVGSAAAVVRGLPLPDELDGDRIHVQGFEDFCALMGNGDSAALYTATHGAVLADPLTALDELQRRCQSALDDSTAINIDSLHSCLEDRAREARAQAAFHISKAVEQLQVALLATAQGHHAATEPDSDGDTTSLQRVFRLLTIGSLRGEIDDLVGIEDRDLLASVVLDCETLTADLDITLSALERYANQVFGACDGHEHE